MGSRKDLRLAGSDLWVLWQCRISKSLGKWQFLGVRNKSDVNKDFMFISHSKKHNFLHNINNFKAHKWEKKNKTVKKKKKTTLKTMKDFIKSSQLHLYIQRLWRRLNPCYIVLKGNCCNLVKWPIPTHILKTVSIPTEFSII